MKQFFASIMLLLMTVTIAIAEPMTESDIPIRYTSWHIAYDVNADGSYVETQKWAATILKESALNRGKNASVTFSTSVAKGEILEAYTIKKSGQRIEAPKNSYQVTTNDGYKKASPLYSDETTISVLLPDLAVGDSMVFSYRVTNSEGIFPKQFSVAHNFSRYLAYDDVAIEITAPVTMDLKHKNYFLTEQKPMKKDGKQTLRWTFQNKTPEKWTPSDSGISVVGDEPSLYVSTFNSYKEIAAAYGDRATPKAAVTERVKKLASEIAADTATPELQTQALYDWVAKNISYGGNCIGVGAVVPRDIDVILDNRMGDCKDHATLLQALLAAKNIESNQALINAGSLYQLPSIPVVSSVNHVINFIPSLNIFLDSTSTYTPFGMLPIVLGEKPVLLVSNYSEGTKTPSMAQYGHEQILRTKLRINANGSATGSMDLKMKGLPGISARAVWRNYPREQEEFAAKMMLEAQGSHGTGIITKDDPTAMLDSYNFSITFNLEDYVPVGSATGILIRPAAVSFLPIEGFLKDAYGPLPKKQQTCVGGKSVEEYELEFPESMNIVAIPKDFSVSGAIIDYKSTYRKSANTLTVRRVLTDKTASNICSPEHAADYKKIMLSIAKDLKSQVLLSD